MASEYVALQPVAADGSLYRRTSSRNRLGASLVNRAEASICYSQLDSQDGHDVVKFHSSWWTNPQRQRRGLQLTETPRIRPMAAVTAIAKAPPIVTRNDAPPSRSRRESCSATLMARSFTTTTTSSSATFGPYSDASPRRPGQPSGSPATASDTADWPAQGREDRVLSSSQARSR